MLTSKKDFERFKAEFLKWAQKLNLQDYHVYFEHTDIGDNFAEIEPQESGKLAVCRFTNEVNGRSEQHYKTPEHYAKHEAIHLLLNRIRVLGQRRFVTQQEMDDEWEKLVRILEKVF